MSLDNTSLFDNLNSNADKTGIPDTQKEIVRSNKQAA